MQDKKTNSIEPLSDKQLENVTGGLTTIRLFAGNWLTCKCGHSFPAQFNAANTFQCPQCKRSFNPASQDRKL